MEKSRSALSSLTYVWAQPKTNWINSNFTYFSWQIMINIRADVMISNCLMFRGRQTAELSLRQGWEHQKKSKSPSGAERKKDEHKSFEVWAVTTSRNAAGTKGAHFGFTGNFESNFERSSINSYHHKCPKFAFPKENFSGQEDLQRYLYTKSAETEKSSSSQSEHVKVDAAPEVVLLQKKRKKCWPRTCKFYTATEKLWLL